MKNTKSPNHWQLSNSTILFSFSLFLSEEVSKGEERLDEKMDPVVKSKDEKLTKKEVLASKYIKETNFCGN